MNISMSKNTEAIDIT